MFNIIKVLRCKMLTELFFFSIITQSYNQNKLEQTPSKTLDLPKITSRINTEPNASVNSFIEPPECGSCNHIINRVVGGVSANVGDVPWTVLLGYKSRTDPNKIMWLCGGSLVSPLHVLTAAHCIVKMEEKLIRVRLGEHDLENENDGAHHMDYNIKKLIAHEGFSEKLYQNDIGLILLNSTVTFTDHIQAICLPIQDNMKNLTFVGEHPIIAGWGNSEFRGASAKVVQIAHIEVVELKSCIDAYKNYTAQAVIDDRVLCAGNKDVRRDVCQGDSGGALFHSILNTAKDKTYYYAIGVVSLGRKCAEIGYPSVYTRVAAFIPWLRKHMLNT